MKRKQKTAIVKAIKELGIENHIPDLEVERKVIDSTEDWQIKIFEASVITDEEVFTWDSLYWVEDYVDITRKHGVKSMVMIEWRKGRENRPYFLLF